MQTLHQFQDSFESYLLNNQFVGAPIELYEPANYILKIGGKRLRPALLLTGHYLFEDDFSPSLPAAFAVEVFHNFTLMHDDIMDAAPLRRGMPTVHQKFGLNPGILSGDVMVILAYEYLLKCPAPKTVEVLQSFNRMAIQVCEGQQMDMNFETQASISIDDYLKMIEYKTAVLVATALEIGAKLGGADIAAAGLLYEFGRNLGIAFQLQDDILDAFGDPSKVGKKLGGDIAQNKKTFLYLKAIELAPEATANSLREYFSDGHSIPESEKIESVLTIFRDLKVEQAAHKVKEDYWQKALESLGKVDSAVEKKNILVGFASALMHRDF
ncbi:MAG: polyprenyl synthetase family protein [Saprospiraceae bacterium]|nr:polyprenyl synthetase family protein [Saprospiraceae bacterium]